MYAIEKLPCCGSMEFYEGPSGGACTNVKCAKCRHKWNVAFIDDQIYIVNDLGIVPRATEGGG